MRRPPLPDINAGVRDRTEKVLNNIFIDAKDDPRDVLRLPLEVDVVLSKRVRGRMEAALPPVEAASKAFDLLWPEPDLEPGRPVLWHVLYKLRPSADKVTR